MTTRPDEPAPESLDPEIDPPPALRRRVERDLRARGLLGPRIPTWQRAAGMVAAGLLLIAGGFWLGAIASGAPRGAPTVSETTAEDRFVLLLYEDEAFTPEADEDALVAEYVEWAVSVAGRDIGITGEKLADAGTLLEGADAAGVDLPDEAQGSAFGRLTGYFVISVENRAEALEVARTSPHLRHGGSIVVRPIEPT